MRHRWTESDDALLRQRYGWRAAAGDRWPTARLAAAIGCTVKAVQQRAATIGLTAKQERIRQDAAVAAKLRELHAAGLLDSEIAAELAKWFPGKHLYRRLVTTFRQRLGLPPNNNNARHRDQVRQRTREQLRRAGRRTLADLRGDAYRRYARERGWPDYLRVRHVQILDLLYEQGPQTREAIATATGVGVTRGQRHWLSSKYGRGSYLADLMAAGFVVRSRTREVRGDRRGKSVHRYYLSPAVVRHQPATWPDKEWAHGQIYGKQPVVEVGGRESAADAGGDNVPVAAACGSVG